MRLALALAVASLSLLWCGNAFAGAYAKTDRMLTMSDGVQIATTLYEPLGAPPVGGWPTIMMFHGFGTTRTSMNAIAESLWATDDYAAFTFDFRGYGESGGLFDLDGPREIQDVRELFDWLGAVPGINKGLIGAWGISLGGGAVWGSLAAGVPFATAEVVQTWSTLYPSLIQNGLVRSGVIAQLATQAPAARTAPELLALESNALSANPDTAALRAFANARSISDDALRKIKIPVFVFQGRRDFLVGIDQAFRPHRLLGGSHGLYIGDFGNAPSTYPGPDSDYEVGQSGEWFDLHLKNKLEAAAHFTAPVELMPDPYDFEAAPQGYGGVPPTTPVSTKTVKVGKTFGTTGKIVKTLAMAQPTKWHETFGSPIVTVSGSTRTQAKQLVAVVEAVPPKGKATIVSEGGMLLPTAKVWTRSFPLHFDTALLKPGTKLRVTLSWTSTAQDPANLLYLTGVPDGSSLTIRSLRLTLPVLKIRVSG